MDSPRDWLLLLRAPGLGSGTLRKLLDMHGSAAAILANDAAAVRQLSGFNAAREWLANPDEALLDIDLAWLDEPDRYLIPCTSAEFPERLNLAHGAPAALFVRGEPAALRLPAIAMVGTRNPTRDGADLAFQFGKELAAAGLVIVSGLAIGIGSICYRCELGYLLRSIFLSIWKPCS